MKPTALTLCLLSFSSLFAETPCAHLKAQYDSFHAYHNDKGEETYVNNHKFVLLIADGESQYYDPQTFFVDSLENDPTGKAALDVMWSEAYDRMYKEKADPFKIMREKGFTAGQRLRVNKDFKAGMLNVRNSNGGDRYLYPVPMDELVWELGDSTKNVLGYECQIAYADYHGRKWLAWFAPEISVQDGPWQLCGLPGLIMEAVTIDGEYGFRITGLQNCNETFKPLFDEHKYFKTKRKSYLKMKDYSRRNRAAQIAAMTNGAVKLSESVNHTGKDDFIETDYHD